MKKHNYKYNLHCITCWNKAIKSIVDYEKSDQYYEDEKRRIAYIDKLNEPILKRMEKLSTN